MARFDVRFDISSSDSIFPVRFDIQSYPMITQKIIGSIHFKLEHIVVYENSSDDCKNFTEMPTFQMLK